VPTVFGERLGKRINYVVSKRNTKSQQFRAALMTVRSRISQPNIQSNKQSVNESTNRVVPDLKTRNSINYFSKSEF
jgi:hypothetical protein